MKTPGYIYLMRFEERLDPWQCAYKVGRSIYPTRRGKQISMVLPYDLILVWQIRVDDAPKYERILHEILSPWHLQGEWFWPTKDWVNWFKSISQYYLDTGEYPMSHEPFVHGRKNDEF